MAEPERGLSAWIGGSILASLSTMEGMFVTKAECEEMGVERCLREKCHL